MNSTIVNGFNSPSISPTFFNSSYASNSSNSSSNGGLSINSSTQVSVGKSMDREGVQVKSEPNEENNSQLITTATLVFTTISDPTKASSTPTTVKPTLSPNQSPNMSPTLSPNANLDQHLDNTLSSLISNLNENGLRSSNAKANQQLSNLLNGNADGSSINSAVCKLLQSYNWTVVSKQQKAPPTPTKRKQHVKRPMNAFMVSDA